MRVFRVFAGVLVVAGVAWSQTAVEYGIAAGKSAAVAAGLGVAARGTVESGLRKTEEALAGAGKSKTARSKVEWEPELTPSRASRAKGKARTAARPKPGAKTAARGKNSRADEVALAEMRAALARPQSPAEPPAVVDPQAIRPGMTREELDALGKPSMSINGADGETRFYRTAGGSLSVRVRSGKVEAIQP